MSEYENVNNNSGVFLFMYKLNFLFFVKQHWRDKNCKCVVNNIYWFISLLRTSKKIQLPSLKGLTICDQWSTSNELSSVINKMVDL